MAPAFSIAVLNRERTPLSVVTVNRYGNSYFMTDNRLWWMFIGKSCASCVCQAAGGGVSPTEGQLGALVDYVDEGAPDFAARCSIVRADGTVLDHTAIERLALDRLASRQAGGGQAEII